MEPMTNVTVIKGDFTTLETKMHVRHYLPYGRADVVLR
jgi:23S rRNA U2552 (ribose-2'-O)-methylase RlmE/FtsJ